MDILLKCLFFALMAIYVALRYFSTEGDSDLATIVFFVAIFDLSNVMSKTEK